MPTTLQCGLGVFLHGTDTGRPPSNSQDKIFLRDWTLEEVALYQLMRGLSVTERQKRVFCCRENRWLLSERERKREIEREGESARV